MISSLRVGLAALALALAPAVTHGQASGRVADSVAVLVARYDSAWNGRDTATVNRLLAPGYQYFTSTGGLTSRTETMRFLSSPEYQLERAGRTEVAIHVTGQVAILSSRWQGRGRYQGKSFVDDQRCGQTWVRSASEWQLLSEHCAQIARPATAAP